MLEPAAIRALIEQIETRISAILDAPSLTERALRRHLEVLTRDLSKLDGVRGDIAVRPDARTLRRLDLLRVQCEALEAELERLRQNLTTLEKARQPTDKIREDIAATEKLLRGRRDDISKTYRSLTAGRHVVPALFDSIAWTLVVGRTIVLRFEGFLLSLADGGGASGRTFDEALRPDVEWAKRFAPVDPATGGAEAGGDEPPAPGAPSRVMGAALRMMQREVRARYTERAFQGVEWGELFKKLWRPARMPDADRIQRLSRRNIQRLLRDTSPLDEQDGTFLNQFKALNFYVKHGTTAERKSEIASAKVILSKIGLYDWESKSPSGLTTFTDELRKQDVDFIFFRVEIGSDRLQDNRYGSRSLIYPIAAIVNDGWITMHDMLAPISSSSSLQKLHLKQQPTRLLRSTAQEWQQQHGSWPKRSRVPTWVHEYYEYKNGKECISGYRTLNVLDEVFVKEDIMDGMALSVLRDLNDMPALREEVYGTMAEGKDQFVTYMRELFPKLYRVEAKFPSYFDYDTEGRVDPDEAAAPRPAQVQAATDTGAGTGASTSAATGAAL